MVPREEVAGRECAVQRWSQRLWFLNAQLHAPILVNGNPTCFALGFRIWRSPGLLSADDGACMHMSTPTPTRTLPLSPTLSRGLLRNDGPCTSFDRAPIATTVSRRGRSEQYFRLGHALRHRSRDVMEGGRLRQGDSRSIARQEGRRMDSQPEQTLG